MFLECQPIGTFYCQESDRYLLPRQPGLVKGSEGRIELLPNCNFEQALEGLEGFDKIWLIFWIHRNTTWKPKILPPRSQAKQGVFATRSPHRPNPIGLSCVTLKEIQGRTLYVEDHDLLNQTPILDIKPYLTYADAFPHAKQGWLENLEEEMHYTIEWGEKAAKQLRWLEKLYDDQIDNLINNYLTKQPFPKKHNRIRNLKENLYEISFKTWRIDYEVNEKHSKLTIIEIRSGYDIETLSGLKQSRWEDVSIHLEFLQNKW